MMPPGSIIDSTVMSNGAHPLETESAHSVKPVPEGV